MMHGTYKLHGRDEDADRVVLVEIDPSSKDSLASFVERNVARTCIKMDSDTLRMLQRWSPDSLRPNPAKKQEEETTPRSNTAKRLVAASSEISPQRKRSDAHLEVTTMLREQMVCTLMKRTWAGLAGASSCTHPSILASARLA